MELARLVSMSVALFGTWHLKGVFSVSTLFGGRTESYAKSNQTSSQGAVGLS